MTPSPSPTTPPLDDDARKRATAQRLGREALRLAQEADDAGMRDCADSFHAARIRADRVIAEMSARGPRR